MADPLVPSTAPGCEAAPSGASFSPTSRSQFTVLDWFFPGFSMYADIVERYMHIDLNLYVPLFLSIGVLVVCWEYVQRFLWGKVEDYFMSVVDIRTDDEIYNILMAWVAGQRFAQGARRFVVNTKLGSRSWNLWHWSDEDDYDYDDGRLSAEKKKKKGLSYTPAFGNHWFLYRGRFLMFRRSARSEQNTFMNVSEREEISISCFGRNPWVLKELLLEAREKYMEQDAHKTQIYRGTTRAMSGEPSWQRCMSRATRPFSTVILNEKTKKSLIDDVTDYLNPATQRWYSNRGIPYRRGYLLHGPPGTGKSSLSLALAGFFKMRIYIVSLSAVTATEEVLGNLFTELPRQCVVLLEDIDTAGLTHTREEGAPPGDSDVEDDDMEPGEVTRGRGPRDDARNASAPTNRLSLSGLLNILDGVASQEGRILIMTTNHIEKLDKALIRPGRIDMTINFGLADEYMITNIYRNIFAYLEGDDGADVDRYLTLSPEERQVAIEKKAKDRAAHQAKVEELAKAFAAKIPQHEFSPAELQGHLLKHKHSPETAIETAEEFIQNTRKDHKDKEIKAAEKKRKDEEKQKEEEKKKQEKKKKKDAEDKIKKRVEEEFQKKFGEEIKKKVAAEMEEKNTKEAGDKTEKSDDKKLKPPKTAESEKKPEQDSGYVTPSSGEP
ncbi:BCS1 N terminal-domain-containing protein [Nemania sp. FL0916]|nr:BCS1 N terminal-domain-containing protein [Nemania sp. FL0916]